ncbi:MAG: hypothetical protein ACLGJE_21250 [Gammaproteobacteria bacterium]
MEVLVAGPHRPVTTANARHGCPMLKYLNRDVLNIKTWSFSILMYSLLCAGFDVYQLFTSSNLFLTSVSMITLLLGYIRFRNGMTEGNYYYAALYLIPITLELLSKIPGAELVGVDKAEFSLSACTTVISTLLPIVATLITVPVVATVSCFSKWLEKKLA